MKRKIFTLLACASFLFASAYETMEIKTQVAKAPKIDGDKSDWGSAWVKLSKEKDGNKTTALTSQFQVAYDNKAFYLIVEVKGDVTPGSDAVAIPNDYERDCMEVFFSMDTTVRGNAYYKGCWQIRKQRLNATGVNALGGGAGGGNVIGQTSFEMVSTGEGDPYYYEAAFTWDTLTQGFGVDTIKPWSKKMFKFDLQIADNSTGAAGGRTQQTFWNDNSDLQWNNTSKFGLVKLLVPVSVKSAVVSASSIKIKSQSIEFANTTNVNVYDVTGKLVIKANNVNSISTAALRSGVYVVTANNESKKFIK
jgi:hypothetical protein